MIALGAYFFLLKVSGIGGRDECQHIATDCRNPHGGTCESGFLLYDFSVVRVFGELVNSIRKLRWEVGKSTWWKYRHCLRVCVPEVVVRSERTKESV